MHSIKTFCGLTAFALTAAAPAHATVLVDFNDENSAPSGWNEITSNSASGVALNDSNGDSSGISLTLSGWSNSSQSNAFLGRNEAPGWATAGQDELNDRFFMSSSSTGSLTLSGLDPNLTYNIELVSSSSSTTGSGNPNMAGSVPSYIKIEDPNGVVDAVNGFDDSMLTGNVSGEPDGTDDWAAWNTAYYENEHPGSGINEYDVEGWLVWNNVTPDGSNEITINFETPGGDARASINAMQVTAVPEPSTYAAVMGAFAIGMLLLRRRMAARK